MARPHIHTYQEINYVIRRTFPDIPSQVDAEGFILANGVVLYKNVYDPVNGNYELHVRDKKNDRWKSFDSEDNPDFIADAAKCFAEFYNAKQKTVKPTDYMADFRKAYNEIRNLQTSLISLVESVPGVSTSAPVTTVKFLRIDNELTVRRVTAKRDTPEIKVFESFFPEGDTKYMCGIRILDKYGSPRNIYRSHRDALPFLIKNFTEETTPAPIPEQDINRLKYLMSDISSILAKHGASLDAVPGGLRLRTGISRPESVNLTIVETEVE
jgi:hypothetical protein